MKSPFHAILALVGGAVAQESVEMPALPVGEPIRGELSSELPVEATEHLRSINLTTATACSQVYRTRVESSGRYRFSMDASAFDPYLILRDADGRLLADDDDGGLGLQARLEVDLEADRLYVLEACSLWCQPGAFELEFHPVSASVEEDSKEARAIDLARRVESIEEDLADGPGGAVTRYTQLGRKLCDLARNDDARAQLERALALHEDMAESGEGVDPITLAEAQHGLGVLEWRAKDYAAARTRLTEALGLYEDAPGADPWDVATTLHFAGLIEYLEKQHSEARSYLERALVIRQELEPHGSWCGNTLQVLGRNEYNARAYERAAEYFQRAARLRSALDPDRSSAGTSFHWSGLAHYQLEAYEDAKRDFLEAVRIREATSPSSSSLGSSLHWLAINQFKADGYGEAVETFLRALGVREEVDPHSLAVSHTLQWLGEIEYGVDNHDQSALYLQRALTIRESLDPVSRYTEDSLSWLAYIELVRFNYDAALIHARRLLDGTYSRHQARGLYVLGMSLAKSGDPEAGLSVFEEAWPALHAATDTSDMARAEVLFGMGRIAYHLFRPELMVDCMERAGSLCESALGGDSAVWATVHFWLGVAYREVGRGEDSQQCLDEAARVLGSEFHELSFEARIEDSFRHRKVLEFVKARDILKQTAAEGRDTGAYWHARALDELAGLHLSMGNREEGLRVWSNAIEVYSEVRGPKELDADYYMHEVFYKLASDWRPLDGRHAEMVAFARRAVQYRARTAGESSLRWLRARAAEHRLQSPYRLDETKLDLARRIAAECERSYGRHYWKTEVELVRVAHLEAHHHGFEESVPILQEIASSARERGERPQWRVLDRLRQALAEVGDLSGAWSVELEIWESWCESEQARALASTDAELFFSAEERFPSEMMIALAVAGEEAALRARAHEAVLHWKGSLLRTLATNRREIADDQRHLLERLRSCQQRLSAATYGAHAEARDMQGLLEERRAIELELKANGALDDPAPVVSTEALRAAMPARSALVTLFASRPRMWHAEKEDPLVHEHWHPDHVYAWVARADIAEVACVDLGPSKAMEDTVSRFLSKLVAHRGAGISTEEADPHAELRTLLWNPLAPHLQDVDRLIVSPDGALATLPWGVLKLEDGTHLLEHFAFSYTQDPVRLLLHGRDDGGTVFGDLLCVGGLDYNESAEAGPDLLAQAGDESPVRGGLASFWPRLSATTFESQAVHDIHESATGESAGRLLLMRDGGTEERLKAELPKYAVVHLATHGFFQPDDLVPEQDIRIGCDAENLTLGAWQQRLVTYHPGLLSGLVCAGANKPRQEGRDDCYLTAEELSWLDGSGIDLVVLSACETGLGRAQAGVGLIGLRHSLERAGVDTVISSLWAVRDDSTSQLMTRFYQNLWIAKMSKGEALRAAQLEMLTDNRRRHGHTQPSTWGAFVLSGEWD